MKRIPCPVPTCGQLCEISDKTDRKTLQCWSCGYQFAVPGDNSVSAQGSLGQSSTVSLIGRFQVRARIGQGGFGVVYRAFDPHLQRDVALKVAHPGNLDTPEQLQRFQREARTSAQLRHP